MSESPVVPRWHRAIAALVSLFMLGAGQIALGRYRRALGLVSAYLLLIVFGAVSGRLGLMDLAIAIAVLVRIFGAVDVVRIAPAQQLPGWGRIILLWIGLLAVVLIGTYGIRRYVIESFRIPSGAMIPTLQVGDHLFVSKLAGPPQRGETIVFMYPVDPDKAFIKRVIGVAGDTVQVCGGQALINGQPLRRVAQPGPCEYQDYDGERPSGAWHIVPCVAYREWNGSESYITIHNPGTGEWLQACTTPVTVPPGHVFVMGDNRDNSHDSRYWGTVPPDLVKGKAWFISWSTGPTGVRWERVNQLVHKPAPPLPNDSPALAVPKPSVQ